MFFIWLCVMAGLIILDLELYSQIKELEKYCEELDDEILMLQQEMNKLKNQKTEFPKKDNLLLG